MDLTFQVPKQYCSLQHQTLFHHQSHPQLSIFTLTLSLHSFWSYFSTLLQHHIGHLPTYGIYLSVSYLFAFSYCHGVFKARILKWFAISFSSGPRFVRTLCLTRPPWVALRSMAYSFIELDKAVVCVISLMSFL